MLWIVHVITLYLNAFQYIFHICYICDALCRWMLTKFKSYLVWCEDEWMLCSLLVYICDLHSANMRYPPYVYSIKSVNAAKHVNDVIHWSIKYTGSYTYSYTSSLSGKVRELSIMITIMYNNIKHLKYSELLQQLRS